MYNLKRYEFEIDSDSVHGYLIELKDSNRQIDIVTNELMVSIIDQDGLLTADYNNREIYYIYRTAIDTEMNNTLIIQFEIDSRAYQINADYNKDVDSETLKSDIKNILDQMIKQ